MKILRILPMGLLLALTACEPGYEEYLVLSNQTQQEAVFHKPEASTWYSWTYRADSIAIPAGDSIKIEIGGGIGYAYRENIDWVLYNCIFPDSCVISFAGGERLCYFASDTTSDESIYNRQSSHFTLWEKPWRRHNVGHLYFASLTYTITPEQVN